MKSLAAVVSSSPPPRLWQSDKFHLYLRVSPHIRITLTYSSRVTRGLCELGGILIAPDIDV